MMTNQERAYGGRPCPILASALATVVTISAGIGSVSAHQAGTDGRPPLPPVVIQSDQNARRTATSSDKPRGSRQRVTRSAQSTARTAPAPAAAGAAGTQLRDGIDGYFAQTTGVGTKTSTPILQLPTQRC